jgi:hypothetical protein
MKGRAPALAGALSLLFFASCSAHVNVGFSRDAAGRVELREGGSTGDVSPGPKAGPDADGGEDTQTAADGSRPDGGLTSRPRWADPPA